MIARNEMKIHELKLNLPKINKLVIIQHWKLKNPVENVPVENRKKAHEKIVCNILWKALLVEENIKK